MRIDKVIGWRAMAVGALAVTFQASSPAIAADASERLAAARGERLAAEWCSSCHVTGEGVGAADIGPTFRDIAARRSEPFLRDFLGRPHERGRMPAFEISREQIDDLVRYFDALR